MSEHTSEQPEELPDYRRLRWVGNRWHLEGKPLNAGDHLQMLAITSVADNEDGSVTVRRRSPDDAAREPWIDVRIESRDSGRWLLIYHWVSRLGCEVHRNLWQDDVLRWPEAR